MESHVQATRNTGSTLMTSSKKIHEYGWLEAKQSCGAVYEQGVRESKRAKALRLITKPLTDKYWKNSGQSVTTLHRINKIAEYLYERAKRNK